MLAKIWIFNYRSKSPKNAHLFAFILSQIHFVAWRESARQSGSSEEGARGTSTARTMSISTGVMAPTTKDNASGEEMPLNSSYKETHASYSSDTDSSSQEESSGEAEVSSEAASSLQEPLAQRSPLREVEEREGTYVHCCKAAGRRREAAFGSAHSRRHR